MADVLPCRSVAEALLYLDLAGWPREGRSQHIEEVDGRWIAVHATTMGGVRHVLRFEAPKDPRPGSFGGPEPSQLIDAGQFVGHASTLAGSTIRTSPGRSAKAPASRAPTIPRPSRFRDPEFTALQFSTCASIGSAEAASTHFCSRLVSAPMQGL